MAQVTRSTRDDHRSQAPLPICLRTTTTGNVFFSGQSVSIGVETDSETVTWTVRDGYGAIVEERSAATRDLDGQIPVGVSAPGWYAVEVFGTDAAGAIQHAGTDIAILEPLPADFVRDERLGVATHYGQWWSTDTVPLVSAAGFGLARDEAYWREQEPAADGAFEWQRNVQEYEAALREHGLGNLRVLSYGNGNPKRDAAGEILREHGDVVHPYCSKPQPEEDFGASDCAPTTDAERNAFAQYALATVQRLTSQSPRETHYFEIWNEWNLRQKSLGGAAYARLVQRVREVLTENGQSVPLIAGALAPYDSEGLWQAWVRDFVASGGLEGIDYFSTHPYADVARVPNEPERSPQNFQTHWEELRAIIGQELGAHSVPPIVITETGWGTQRDERGVSEDDQAMFLTRGVLYALAEGVANVTIYDFMDDGPDPAEREHRLGLIRHETDPRGAYVPKPAYVASAVANRAIAGLTKVAHEAGLGPGAWAPTFESADGTRRVRAAWALEPTPVAISSGGHVQVTGMFGDVTNLTPDASGRVTLTLTQRPVYLSGPITAVEPQPQS